MLIFYTAKNPVVIIDAMCSDDRLSKSQIAALVKEMAPKKTSGSSQAADTGHTPQEQEQSQTGKSSGLSSTSQVAAVSITSISIYSCEYSCEFAHNGIPLGQGMKTRFSAVIRSAPAALVSTFSPSFLTSSQSIEDMADATGKIANPQTTLIYGAMVIQGQAGNVKRSFIAYAAPVEPDPMGTTTTMFVQGAAIDDLLIKSECAFQLSKTDANGAPYPLITQLNDLLQKNNYTGTFNALQAAKPPAANILFRPMQFNALIDEICLQNKMIPIINTDKMNVTFNAADPSGMPAPSSNSPSFSFLGYRGYMAWGLGVENYANVKFKAAMFDPVLFQSVTIYNDIASAFFQGLDKSPASGPSSAFTKTVDKYAAFIIRYTLRWGRDESLVELTASNNWLMAMFRVDGLLETAVYKAALK
jgi:hypothetical protein